ncbi:hypothetical protein AVEN_81059-1, partial [Araneus ventricosus]
GILQSVPDQKGRCPCPFGPSDAYLRKDVIDDSSCLAAMHQEKISRTRITELMFRLLCAEGASVLKQTQ